MTPKDKAIELVWKYYHNIEHTISNEYASKDWEIAKQCALIAVDEISQSGPSYPYDIQFDAMPHFRSLKYWQDVKNEIDKL